MQVFGGQALKRQCRYPKSISFRKFPPLLLHYSFCCPIVVSFFCDSWDVLTLFFVFRIIGLICYLFIKTSLCMDIKKSDKMLNSQYLKIMINQAILAERITGGPSNAPSRALVVGRTLFDLLR